MAWAVQFPGVPGWSSQKSSDKTRLCWYQQEQLKQHIRGCGCRQWCPWCYSQFNWVTQGNTWPSAETESHHAFHRKLAECAACAGPQNNTCITDRTEGEILRDESASPATLTAALHATVSAGGEDKEKGERLQPQWPSLLTWSKRSSGGLHLDGGHSSSRRRADWDSTQRAAQRRVQLHGGRCSVWVHNTRASHHWRL